MTLSRRQCIRFQIVYGTKDQYEDNYNDLVYLSDQLNNTTGGSDLLLGQLGDESGLNDDGDIGQSTLTKDLTVTVGQGVNDGSSRSRCGLEVLVLLGGVYESPQLVQVDFGLPEASGLLVEVAHTNLTKVTRMVLIHVGTVVVLTTGLTATTGMLSVLTDSTLTGRNVTSVLSSLCESGRHCCG